MVVMASSMNEVTELATQAFVQLLSARPRRVAYPEIDRLTDVLQMFDDKSLR